MVCPSTQDWTSLALLLGLGVPFNYTRVSSNYYYKICEWWKMVRMGPVPCRHQLIRHLLTSCPNKTRPHFNPIANFLSWEIATFVAFLWLEASTLMRSYACPTFGKICQIFISPIPYTTDCVVCRVYEISHAQKDFVCLEKTTHRTLQHYCKMCS